MLACIIGVVELIKSSIDAVLLSRYSAKYELVFAHRGSIAARRPGKGVASSDRMKSARVGRRRNHHAAEQ